MPDLMLASWSQEPSSRCHLCGETKKLTFEHIPPKSCFNNKQRKFYAWESLMRQHKGSKKFNRGLGRKVLCAQCNKLAGDNYVPHFREFVSQLAPYAHNTPINNSTLASVTFRPGAVAKQLAHIACSMSEKVSIGEPIFERLRNIASNPSNQLAPERVKIFIYLTSGSDLRLSGVASRLINNHAVLVFSEVALPPIGIVVMEDDAKLNNACSLFGLYDTRSFFDYPIDHTTSLHLWLQRLRPVGPGPLDFAGINAAL